MKNNQSEKGCSTLPNMACDAKNYVHAYLLSTKSKKFKRSTFYNRAAQFSHQTIKAGKSSSASKEKRKIVLGNHTPRLLKNSILKCFSPKKEIVLATKNRC